MWLYVWTELKYSRILLGIGLAIASAISLALVFDDETDKLPIFWVVIYVISLTVSAANFDQEKRERLYTQLPLTRIQITLGDLCTWLAWTALFYGGTSLFYFAALSPVDARFLIDLLGIYLSVMGWMGLVATAVVLTNFRNRYWQAGYIAAAILLVSIVMGNTTITSDGEGIDIFIFDYALKFIAVAFLFALTSVSAFYLVSMRQDYYFK